MSAAVGVALGENLYNGPAKFLDDWHPPKKDKKLFLLLIVSDPRKQLCLKPQQTSNTTTVNYSDKVL